MCVWYHLCHCGVFLRTSYENYSQNYWHEYKISTSRVHSLRNGLSCDHQNFCSALMFEMWNSIYDLEDFSTVHFLSACQMMGFWVMIVSNLVSWCCKPSQPQRIISGLRETFIKRDVVQRTSKADQDQKNRVRRRWVVERIYGMKYSWKGHKDRNRRKNRTKKKKKGVGKLNFCLFF